MKSTNETSREAKTMNKKRLFSTIIISIIAFAINYFINFFLTPFITSNIGTDAYGFVTLAKTFASYAVIATTALNSYAARFISISYHKDDINQSQIYFSSVFWGNAVIGLVLVLLCSAFSGLIAHLLKVSSSISFDVQILFILVFINLFFNLVGTAFQTSAYVCDKLYIVSIFKGISYVAEAGVLFCIYSFFQTPRVFYVGIGLIVASVIVLICNYCITKKHLPEFTISLKFFRLSAVKELIVNGLWNSMNSLGNTLNSGLDLLVTNRLLGSLALGEVSIIKSIVGIFSSLYQLVSQAFQPSFLRCYAKNETKELLSSLKLSMKISGWVSNIIFACVVGLGYCYYNLWVPDQNVELLYKLTIIAVATSIFEGAVYPLCYIYTLTVKNKIPCIITLIGGAANVIGMIVLIKFTSMGIYAVFITTAVIMLFIYGVTNPIYMAHCLKVPRGTFYPALIRHTISCVTTSTVVFFVSKALNPSSWLSFIIVGLIDSVIVTIFHFLIVFELSDWKRIKRFVIKH